MFNILFAVMLFFVSGCASVEETAKTIWGSSTRALNEARSEALTKTFSRGYWEVLRMVVTTAEKTHLYVFKKDTIRGEIILMKVPGCVDTTEVGIFIVEISDNESRVEISSLSTRAKRAVARLIFKGLDVAFTPVSNSVKSSSN